MLSFSGRRTAMGFVHRRREGEACQEAPIDFRQFEDVTYESFRRRGLSIRH